MTAATLTTTFAPFRYPTFAVLWSATLISNIGTWMHSIGASWLMTDLSTSPLMVSLVQTATTLPIVFFALLAGAIADIFNRRTLLMVTNVGLLTTVIVFAILVWQARVTPWVLLGFTFIIGSFTAFMAPAWQAIVPRMVGQSDLPQAVALSGISVNLSRAIGPALAGVLISLYGITTPFAANATSFIVILGALWWWKNESPRTGQTLPSEKVWRAMRAGLRYARYSTPLKNTLWNALGFMFFANTFWSLLPVVARNQLNGDATFFGFLMGAIGLGAVTGVVVLTKLRERFNANQIVLLGSLLTASVTAYVAVSTQPLIAIMVSTLFGAGWVLVLASVNVSAQQALPDWVRARGLSIYMMIVFGSMSLGSAFWGWFADMTSVTSALLLSAVGNVLAIWFARRFELQQGQGMDLTPSFHWPAPSTFAQIGNDAGPVIIEVRYSIRPEDRCDFLQAIEALKALRKRDGAYNWCVYEDVEREGCYVEHFMEHSWVEHLRHHERVTQADKPLQDKVRAFHQGDQPPVVNHYLSAECG